MDRGKRLSARAQASPKYALREFKERYALTRLQRLLELAQQSPGASAQITAEGARRLSELLAGFAGFDLQGFKSLAPQQIAKLLAEVLNGIQKLAGGRPWELTERLTRRVQPGRRIIQSLFYGGDLGAAVRWNAQELAAGQITRIARCAAPNCERLFIRRKAGTFCSPKCAGRARFARYYARHKHELSELRRKRYRERATQQNKHGRAGKA